MVYKAASRVNSWVWPRCSHRVDSWVWPRCSRA